MNFNSARLSDLLGEGTPVFLAGFDRTGERLTLHVPAGHYLAEVKSRAKLAVDASKNVQVVVRAHQVHQLAYPRSLEHWLKKFDVENVIHDPTMILERARLLVAAAKSCRKTFGDVIRSLAFDPNSRTLFVVVKQNRGGAQLHAQISEVIGRVWACSENVAQAAWRPAIQVVSDLPRRKVVAVDVQSASLWRRVGGGLGRWRKPGLVALALSALTVPAVASNNSADFAHRINATQSSNAGSLGEYGVLVGLSVFTDGQRPMDAGAFALSGFDTYFAEGEQVKSGKLLQLAQKTHKRRRRDPEEVGQVGGGGGGGGGAPGS